MMGFWNTLVYGPQVEERHFGQVTDIGVAFAQAIAEIVGAADDSISSVYRGQQLLSDIVASLPMESVNDATGQVEERQFPVLWQPSMEETYHDTLSQIMASLIWDGNAFLRPLQRSNTGEIKKIHLLHPDEVSVVWDKQRIFREYAWRDVDLVPNRDVFHIAINRWPGRERGVGPISAARLTMRGIKAQDNYARKLFEDDATPPFALTIPQAISRDEAKAILEAWMDTHQGRKTPGVLGGGAGIEVLGIKPVDAEFLMSRNFSVQEIARFLGVHPYFLGVPAGDSLTYATTESLFRLMLTSTLNPTYLERIQQTFTMMLPQGHSARFDVNEILRADILTRYQAQGVAISSGFATPNEIRAMEGWAPLPGGDELAAEVKDGVGATKTSPVME